MFPIHNKGGVRGRTPCFYPVTTTDIFPSVWSPSCRENPIHCKVLVWLAAPSYLTGNWGEGPGRLVPGAKSCPFPSEIFKHFHVMRLGREQLFLPAAQFLPQLPALLQTPTGRWGVFVGFDPLESSTGYRNCPSGSAKAHRLHFSLTQLCLESDIPANEKYKQKWVCSNIALVMMWGNGWRERVYQAAGLQLELWRISPTQKGLLQETSGTAGVYIASRSEMLSRSKQMPQQCNGWWLY